MKLAFLYPNRGLGAVDCRNPEIGNPGVGGTQYCFLLLMYYLSLSRKDWEIVAYVLEETKLPLEIKQIKVEDISTALRTAEQESVDFFITTHNISDDVCHLIDILNIKVVIWSHNFYLAPLTNSIAETSNIVANVFVGKQQYDRYIDHPIINKSITIFNMINDPYHNVDRNNDSSTVVYLGSLVPSKGFHLLAKMWKSIIKENPSAKLKVIGKGNVYNRDTKLGAFNIADEKYEDLFFPYLTDENGKLLDSVDFLGVLGAEKYDVFFNASVGVINPSARTETFGMGIVEMATAKLPVVTLRKNGFIDTVTSGKTGFLCSSQSDIKNKILLLLRDVTLNNQMGENAKEYISLFSPKNIVNEWINLFERLENGLPFNYIKPSKPYSNNFKWARIVNRFLRKDIKLKFIKPLISYETLIYSLLKK